MMVDKMIKEIQKALKGKGFDPIEVDGNFGKDTQSAVIAFQSFAGLVIDGEVGFDTLKALGLKYLKKSIYMDTQNFTNFSPFPSTHISSVSNI